MKDYELTVVFHPDLEMNIDPALDKVKKLIAVNHGEITKEEVEGKKRLAYPIGTQEFGIYYYFDVKLPAEAPNKMAATLSITDEVIRYLLVRADARKAKAEARRKAKAEAEAAKAPEATSESAEAATEPEGSEA